MKKNSIELFKIATLLILLEKYPMHEIPIIHINGGEKTIGSTDDMFRHCITKLSNYHFVSCKK